MPYSSGPEHWRLRGRGIALAFALAVALAISWPVQSFGDGLETACHSLLQRYVFNCHCTSEFLEETLSPEHAEIMLKLWIFAINDQSQNHLVLNVYIQHGRKAVDDAVMNFHQHRSGLRSYCSAGDGPMIAD